MRRVCADAVARGVRIGAQVGYRDLAGFGRRAMDVASDELQADIVYQIGALDGFARLAGDRVRYVKPHGALYNTAMVDERQADRRRRRPSPPTPRRPAALLGLPDSALECGRGPGLGRLRRRGVRRPRLHAIPVSWCRASQPGAVLTDPAAVVAQALALVEAGSARSLCLHGDTPGAVELARQVRAALAAAGVDVRPFR